MQIKIINRSNNELPAYGTALAAGMDIRANLGQPIVIEPLHRAIIETGLYVEIAKGYEAQIRPRSGLACLAGAGLRAASAACQARRAQSCIKAGESMASAGAL